MRSHGIAVNPSGCFGVFFCIILCLPKSQIVRFSSLMAEHIMFYGCVKMMGSFPNRFFLIFLTRGPCEAISEKSDIRQLALAIWGGQITTQRTSTLEVLALGLLHPPSTYLGGCLSSSAHWSPEHVTKCRDDTCLVWKRGQHSQGPCAAMKMDESGGDQASEVYFWWARDGSVSYINCWNYVTGGQSHRCWWWE